MFKSEFTFIRMGRERGSIFGIISAEGIVHDGRLLQTSWMLQVIGWKRQTWWLVVKSRWTGYPNDVKLICLESNSGSYPLDQGSLADGDSMGCGTRIEGTSWTTLSEANGFNGCGDASCVSNDHGNSIVAENPVHLFNAYLCLHLLSLGCERSCDPRVREDGPSDR